MLLLLTSAAGAASGGNCVAYAREVTGIRLDGNAGTWWPHAEGRYERGHQPSVGAVLVFRPSRAMHVGHVAVVARVVGPREILVDQANWVRGRVTRAMSVVDASAQNDWTSVKVLEPHSQTHGRENAAFGFIYPRMVPASLGDAATEPTHDRRHPTRLAERATPPKDRREPHQAGRADPAKPHRLAATTPTHHKPKAPDAKLAYLY
jgi:surface antigen